MSAHAFAGSGTLIRFIFRRDRYKLLIWVLGLAGFIILMIPVFDNFLVEGTNNKVMAEMMQNPAMIAIVGPVYGSLNYTAGAAFSNMMLVFSVMLAGIMNIFFISRHTRQDEELGRLEMIRSLPVGSLSNLGSTITVSIIINLLLAIITGLGLFLFRDSGMSFSGCMLFGAALFVIGLFFGGATALFCQLSANNRTVLGLSFLLLFLLYLLRASGDIGNEALSLISPPGLILRTKIFVDNIWQPVFIIFAITVLIIMLAFILAGKRDLNRGLLPEHPGRHHAARLLSTSFGLALRLLKTTIIIWILTIFALAAMYGSVFGDLESFIKSNEMLQAIFSNNPDYSMTEQFVVLLMTIMSIISTIPVLLITHHVSTQEKNGYAEHIYSKAVSRYSQLTAYLIPAFVISIILQLLTAFGFWFVGSMVLVTAPSFLTFLQSAIAYLPAIWVMIGISLILIAYIPNRISLSFIYLGYGFISVYMGAIANLPDWMKKLTPFGFIPGYPIEKINASVLFILVFIAIMLTAVSYWRFGKRDMRI